MGPFEETQQAMLPCLDGRGGGNSLMLLADNWPGRHVRPCRSTDAWSPAGGTAQRAVTFL
ncbi:hypothetical protein PERCYII10_4101 [Pseudomonas aeruginosa]|nr:hypothetical protein PERCYII10_4101 [Pseudomonas aeruginosa]